MANLSQIKNKIVDGIKYATEKVGFKLIQGDWGNKDARCACALGCALIANDHGISADTDQNEFEAAEILGVSQSWVENFISGFDNELEANITDVEAFELGQEIRDQFKPETELTCHV